MRIILLLVLVFACNTAFAQITSIEDVRSVTRIVKETQEDLDATTNKSMHSLKNRKIQPGTYFGKNFSYCDFEGTDIRGGIFQRCNFSFAINLDKAITDKKTLILESNLTFALDLPKAQMIRCNLGPRPITDKMIEDFFEKDIISSDNLISR